MRANQSPVRIYAAPQPYCGLIQFPTFFFFFLVPYKMLDFQEKRIEFLCFSFT
jgi:hypothetical protein